MMPRPGLKLAICAGLLLLVVFGWIRSYFHVDEVRWSDSSRFAGLISSGGRINFTWTVWPNRTAWQGGWQLDSYARTDDRRPHWEKLKADYGRRRLAGFEWSNAIWPLQDDPFTLKFIVPTYRLVAVPYWSLCFLPPALWLMLRAHSARQRQRLARANRCPGCGYDLRATPDRCPECGLVPAGAA